MYVFSTVLHVPEPRRQAFPFIQEMLTGVPLKLGKSQVRLTGGEQAGNYSVQKVVSMKLYSLCNIDCYKPIPLDTRCLQGSAMAS